jgi:hypothetical protein
MSQTRPVISFITSLRHPGTTDRYGDVVRLLDDTLRSLDAQRDRRFEAVVVANEAYEPPAGLGYPVRSFTTGFACPPRDFADKDERHASIKLDKGLKLAVAMARSQGAHAMCLDSDDFVSRRVVEFVGAHAGEHDGWFVERGIRYDVSAGLYRPQRNFNDVCGTSLIWRRGIMPDVSLGDEPSADEVLDAYGRERVVEELGSHRTMRRKYGFAPLPFPAAVYAVNHGNNHAPAASLRLGLPIGRRRAAEFGIRPPEAAAARRAAAAQLRPSQLREAFTGVAGAARGVVRSRRG